MHDPWHKLIPPGAGFFGAMLMMSYLGEMPKRMWFVALGMGVLVPYFGTEVALHWLEHQFPWLRPDDGHNMSLAGLIGFAMGLMSIHLIGALATVGRRFAEDPQGFGK